MEWSGIRGFDSPDLIGCVVAAVYVEIQKQRHANNSPWRPCVLGRSRIRYPRALVMYTIGDWRPIDLDHYAREHRMAKHSL